MAAPDLSTGDLKLRFHPWIGPRYATGGILRCRLLVLGESHYVRAGTRASKHFTSELTADVVSGKLRHRFWTTVARLVLGKEGTADERAEFWRSVAFYNYVQAVVGPKARIRPADVAWTDSARLLRLVLSRLRPDAMLVLGKSLWLKLPAAADTSPTSKNQRVALRWYPTIRNALCVAAHVRHPASFGFSWRKWVHVPTDLMAVATNREA